MAKALSTAAYVRDVALSSTKKDLRINCCLLVYDKYANFAYQKLVGYEENLDFHSTHGCEYDYVRR